MDTPLRVGIVGAGAVTQSIHLPALARLPELFGIVHVSDIDTELAQTVAGRVGARWSKDAEAVWTDTDVDVVAICSPAFLHADQVIAACRAGVKAVLCEKPFATSLADADRIAAVADETGVPIVVGAMHAYDPAWLDASARWGDLPETAHSVTSSIVMPGGTRFEDFAMEVIRRPGAPMPAASTPEARAARLEGIILGLIIHDLPLIRRFAPTVDDVLDVEVAAGTWSVLYRSAGRTVRLVGGMAGGWKPEWRLEAVSTTTVLAVEFQPSYVWAGSGSSTIAHADGTWSNVPADYNGYEGEWRALAALARGEAAPAAPVHELIDDVRYAAELVAATRTFLIGAAA